ncbi:MAG: hypothetical protein IJJ69_09180 [Oscillospiraceae bacterium]|nr:hypothetical protein [Oscillospiraceae bacterium]
MGEVRHVRSNSASEIYTALADSAVCRASLSDNRYIVLSSKNTENNLLQIDFNSGSYSTVPLVCFNTTGEVLFSSGNISNGVNPPNDFWMTDYGIFFDRVNSNGETSKYDNAGIVTLDSKDDTVCLFISGNAAVGTSGGTYSNVLHRLSISNGVSGDTLKYDDGYQVNSIATDYFNHLKTINTTILCPFFTGGELNEPHYTPNAFFLPASQTGRTEVHLVTINEAQYLTNGLWALKA